MPLPALLIAAAAVILFLLGTIHLVYTFGTNKFDPRDDALKQRMQEISPVITKQTTMWKAWVGFNASHSLGAMQFGLVYAYLALAQPQVLLQSVVLTVSGLAMLAVFCLLGWRYWFSIPFRGIVLATVLYAAGVALSL